MQTKEKRYILIYDQNSKHTDISSFFDKTCDGYNPFTDKEHYIHWYREMGFYYMMTPIGSEWDIIKLNAVFAKSDEVFMIIDFTDGKFCARLPKTFWDWEKKFKNLTNIIDKKSRLIKIEKIKKHMKNDENKIRREKMAYVKSEIQKTAELNELRKKKFAYVKQQIKKAKKVSTWTKIKNLLKF
jgi:hypothetical protein